NEDAGAKVGQQPGPPHPQGLRRRGPAGGGHAGRAVARGRQTGHPAPRSGAADPRRTLARPDRPEPPRRGGPRAGRAPGALARGEGGYVPDRGDAVWIALAPRAGHEQAGRRPALVLTPAAYNGRVGLALLCPITGQAKGYPFEVPLPEGLAVTGVALA